MIVKRYHKLFLTLSLVGLGATAWTLQAQSENKDATSAAEAVADATVATAEKIEFPEEIDKVSYALGVQVGQALKSFDIDLNKTLFDRGLVDSMGDKELAMTMQECVQHVNTYRTEQASRKAAKNLEDGQKYLKENGEKEGVTVLPSGLQYKILTEGEGPKPTAEDRVKVHYRGTLIDGSEFDSSYSRNAPATFGVTQVIKGWTEALQLMPVGSKWMLYIPANLAYGERDRPSIPGNSTLIFEVELLEIVK